MRCAGTRREAWALLRDRCKAGLFAARPLHFLHHAMMLAVSSAAGRQIRIRVMGEQRRNQHPAEQHYQR